MRRFIMLFAGLAAAAMLVPFAQADTAGPITFEPPTYATGNINNQDGWQKTGTFDVNVVAISAFPAAAGYGFGSQSLQLSDAVTSG